jgi:hypothetical protein
MLRSRLGWLAVALAALFVVDVVEAAPTEGGQSGTPTITLSPTPAEESPLMKKTVPQRILDPILNEAAARAKVPANNWQSCAQNRWCGATARWDARNRE